MQQQNFTKMTMCVFGSWFIKLILERINFVRIDLIKIDFKAKQFIFGISFKSDSDRNNKFSLIPESILEVRIDFDF